MTIAPVGSSRKRVRAATSAGSTSRPSGGTTGGTDARFGSSSIAVRVGPGATTLTVIRRGASSAAQARAMAASAAFVAAYWLLPGTPVMVRLPTSTTRPAVDEDVDEAADDELGAAHVHGPHPLALLGPQLAHAGGVLQAGGVDDGVDAAGRGLAHRPHGLVGRDHVGQVARHPRGGVRQRAAGAAEPEDVPAGTDEVVRRWRGRCPSWPR